VLQDQLLVQDGVFVIKILLVKVVDLAYCLEDDTISIGFYSVKTGGFATALAL